MQRWWKPRRSRVVVLAAVTILASSSVVYAQPAAPQVLGVGGAPLAVQQAQPEPAPDPGVEVQTFKAVAAPPVMETFAQLEAPPQLTPAQEASLKARQERMNRPAPNTSAIGAQAPISGAPPAGATGSAQRAFRSAVNPPSAPGDPLFLKNTAFGGIVPAGFKSNVMEANASGFGKFVFYTGNWFAARSINGGTSFSYINPASGYSTFCCDQVTAYDTARKSLLWVRMASPSASGVNTFRLGVSTNDAASFCTYSFTPTNLDASWTNQWFDYPHLQLGADFAYLTWNIFNASDVWQRTVIMRLPLDSLASCAGLSYEYYWNSSWFTFTPVQGANHTMYFASNNPQTSPFASRISIWRWHESDGFGSITQFIKTVAAWSDTGRNSALCGASAGNWAARTDDRILAGSIYRIANNNLKILGRDVIGFWWNVRQGGSFAQPYIDGAAFFEDTLVQLAGLQGRPYVFNSTICFLYPSAAANGRGDLSMVFHYSTGTAKNPSVGVAISDDYTSAPPGWTFYNARTSNARPTDNKWGDYNAIRPFAPSERVWIGGAHYLGTSGVCCSAAIPFYFVFGRERDQSSWSRWQN